MEIKLAGFNVDIDGLNEVKSLLENNVLSDDDKQTALGILNNLTPETISAAYARISRDPRPLYDLRKSGRQDVEGSRKSNKAIIFTMGHKSVAEHAIFNFDVVGISRRAVEEIEEKRLQAYTEKSQRYITLDGDFVLPKEVMGTRWEKKFLKLIDVQNKFYHNMLPILTTWHSNQDYKENFNSLGCGDDLKRQASTLEGYGKEDARYSLSQSTQAQLGMTTSARNIEVLITKLRSSKVEEFKEIGEALFREVDGVAPSVIKYTKPSDYFSKTRDELREHIGNLLNAKKIVPQDLSNEGLSDVVLFHKLNRDTSIIAGLIFSSSNLDYGESLSLTKSLNVNEKNKILSIADKYQESFDSKLREYELGDRVAEFTMSSSAFAQMKRHRMNTLISQKYMPSLGFTTPESILKTGNKEQLKSIIEMSGLIYSGMIKDGIPFEVAEYALTNAHKRRVLLDANNRQVHAFCMERENLPAQWDIRAIANQYHDIIQTESPLTLANLTGKDKFYQNKDKR